MKRAIRGGMGLGDALYVQAVTRHLTARGQGLKVCTAWPDIFKPLNGSVELAPFTRLGNPIVAHYTMRKGVVGTSQFQDVCLNAGVKEPVELKLDWQVVDQVLVNKVRQLAAGKPVVLVQLMRPPMDRKDKFGASLLPRGEAVQVCLDRLRERGAFLVQVGAGRCLYQLTGIDLDLSNQTTVSQLIDLAAIADHVIGYPSFIVPLAESLGKSGLYVWSARGLRDPIVYVRQVTPAKVIHRTGLAVVAHDDWSVDNLRRAADALLDKS